MLAAIARSHGLTLVSNNCEFNRVAGVEVADWAREKFLEKRLTSSDLFFKHPVEACQTVFTNNSRGVQDMLKFILQL